MLQGAISQVAGTQASAATKVSMFERFAAQISSRVEGWEATRVSATGGATVFIGEKAGRIVVIDSSGKVFTGSVDALKQTKGGLEVSFDKLNIVR
jgi:hypothetical protein